jgi:hypothetical protein
MSTIPSLPASSAAQLRREVRGAGTCGARPETTRGETRVSDRGCELPSPRRTSSRASSLDCTSVLLRRIKLKRQHRTDPPGALGGHRPTPGRQVGEKAKKLARTLEPPVTSSSYRRGSSPPRQGRSQPLTGVDPGHSPGPLALRRGAAVAPRRGRGLPHSPGRGPAVFGKSWWAQTGSNCRPQPCKGRALPTELCARKRAPHIAFPEARHKGQTGSKGTSLPLGSSAPLPRRRSALRG